ncbi:MAG: hypothetical protein CMH56_09880, partial [Myxococcales bacterium]|nr:hypothetical protein [Myxococcales bacterium]
MLADDSTCYTLSVFGLSLKQSQVLLGTSLLLLSACSDAVLPGPIQHRNYEPGTLTKIPGVNAPYEYLEDYAEEDRIPHELVVRLADHADETGLIALLETEGLLSAESASPEGMADDGVRRLVFEEEANLDDIFETLRDSEDVAFVEPNLQVSAIGTPDDPMWDDQWGPAKIDAPEAWDHMTTNPAHLVVAVIDTGIDYTHPDLVDAMWTNEGEIPDNGVDDDGNGYVDDIYGYDFVNNDADPYDDHYHGTHCAGIIGASHNQIGVAGVAPNVKMMGLKFLAANGFGSSYGAAMSVRYANDMGVPITNNSWGGGPYSALLYGEINTAKENGSIFVAAAGNNSRNTDQYIYYPMGYDIDNILSVGSSTGTDTRSYFSNYGQTTVDLFAPGSGILATFPNSAYASISGTSMAAPHVAGAAAVLWSALPPNTAYRDVMTGLLENVDPVEAFASSSVTGGRLNLLNAMSELASPAPETPEGFAIIAGVESDIQVTWTALEDENIGGYRVYYGTDPNNFSSADVSASETSHRLTNLQNDSLYFVELVSFSLRGVTSPPTDRLSATPTDGIDPAGVLNLSAYLDSGLELPTTVIATSGDYGAEWNGEASIDDDTNTAWSAPILTERMEHDLLYSFGGSVEVGQVRIYHGDGFIHYFPASFDVESSEDGNVWETVVSESGYSPEAGTWGIWNFPALSATMIRFRVTEPRFHENGLYYAVLPEIGFYEGTGADNAAQLSWSASGDDGFDGQATVYDVRYSQSPINSENFLEADRYTDVAAPAVSGSLETASIEDLLPEHTYYFALVVEDEAGNRSPVSNVASLTTLGLPPAGVTDLRAIQVQETSAVLGWTAPGDDHHVGQAQAYDLRMSTSLMHSGTFSNGTPIMIAPPAVAGTAETITVEGLLPQTRYFFAIRTIDDTQQTSVLSNVLEFTTGNPDDHEPPAAVNDLSAYVEALQGGNLPVLQATSNGDYPGDWSVGNLIDGSANTAWASTALVNQVTPAEVVFTLDTLEPIKVAGVRMTPYSGFLELFPKAFHIEISVDGEDYMPVADRTAFPRPDGPAEILFEAEDARYVKLVVNEVTEEFQNQYAVLAGFEVFAPADNGFEVVVQFTAPGDDAHLGQATRYDLRYAEETITESNFGTAAILMEGSPDLAGRIESYRFSSLMGERTYYFALKTVDDVGNWSLSSNVAMVNTPAIPPAAIVDLVAEGGPGFVDLSWTAPGDDGRMGQASLYEIRWSASPITPYNFSSAFIIANSPAPLPATTVQNFRHTGLDNEESRYYAIKTLDEHTNSSLLSNVVFATSWDVVPPSEVTGLSLDLIDDDTHGEVLEVSFEGSGDDGLEGEASGYELYVHTEAVSDSNLEDATMVPLSAVEFRRVLPDLQLETEYHVAIRAFDNQPNTSGLSESLSAFTAGVPPQAIDDFTLVTAGVNTATFTWTASGDDGAEGTLSFCEMQLSQGAVQLPSQVFMDPLPGGAMESRTIIDLQSNAGYTVQVSCHDDRNHVVTSNAVTFVTDDGDPPAQVMDLSAITGDVPGELNLAWTAPGDNGTSGTATAYEIRYHVGGAFTAAEFTNQILWENTSAPLAAGESETRSLALDIESYVCVAMRAIDDKGLMGQVSNIACADTGWQAPAAVDNLTVGEIELTTINLAWTASGDNGDAGTAAVTHLRYATTPITEETWADATPHTGLGTPAGAGTPESAVVANLQGATSYYFAMKIEDDKGLLSPLSNVVTGHTEDTVPPGAIDDLVAARSSISGTIQLTWTAAGENDFDGIPASLDIRYAATSADAFDWASATVVENPPGVGMGGLPSSAYLSSLALETEHCFAIKTTDTVGNISDISNVACVATHESPPAAVTDLTVTALSGDSVRLSWSAPGASENEGQASSYEIRYQDSTLNDGNWAQANVVTGPPVPSESGQTDEVSIAGLQTDTVYFFAIKSTDDRGNVSEISNIATGESLDEVAPAAISDLSATTGNINGTINITWTSVGDSGNNGGAASYDIRYSTSLIDDSNFENATAFVYGLTPKTAGQNEQTTVSALTYEQDYYLAIKAIDESGNVSPISNVVMASTADVAPSVITSLSVTHAGIGEITLQWNSTGDDGITGLADHFDLRYSTASITSDNWASAFEITGEPVPAGYGVSQNMTVSALSDDTVYYFALKTVDERGNASALSNVVSGQTQDVAPPSDVTTLVAQPPLGDGSVIEITTATVTSTYSSAWQSVNLFDGDASTSWATEMAVEAGTQSINIEWAATTEVGAVTLLATQDYEHLFPKDFTLQLSEDGVTWETVASEQGFEAAVGANRWSFDGVTANRLRIDMAQFGMIAGQMIAMVAEVELEETPPDPQRLNLRWLAV